MQGYRAYLGVFYVLVATLFLSTGICVWVGWCFKNDSFPFLWPIKVARVVVSLFVSMFYIASLNVFLIAMQCEPSTYGGKRHWVHLIYHLGAAPLLKGRGEEGRRGGRRSTNAAVDPRICVSAALFSRPPRLRAI